MVDFIDRQATMNVVGLTSDAINFNPTKYIDAQGNELVAVVRCKDCKWYYILNGHNHCDLLDIEARDIRPDWFCADGERKEDAN